MYVVASPSRGPTRDTGLGFDFDWGSIGTAFKEVAPSIASVYAAKTNVDMQLKLAKAQANQQAAINRAAMMPPSPYPSTGYGVPQPAYANYPTTVGTQGRGAGIGDGLPQWVMPAAIAGGVGILALVLLRR